MDEMQRARLDAHAIQAHKILVETSAEGEVDQTETYVLGYTGAGLPSYNYFIPLNLTGLTDETLADASAFFRTRDTLYAVSLEEHRVSDGTEYLSRRRYQPLPPQPIMAATQLPSTRKADENLIIQAVDTVPGMTGLYSVLQHVYDYSPDEVMLLYPMTQLERDDITHFVGFTSDGVPVTAATAVYAEGVVSVWNMGTLDDYRRKGYASALLNHILIDAAGRGCDMGLVYATPMSFSLFNELGFKLYAMRQWFLPQEIG